jgi:hypothetical protein
MAARNDAIREAAILLMRKGLATPFEIAWLSGMSRQLTRHWARSCIDSREAYLRRIWEKTLVTVKAEGHKTVTIHRKGVPVTAGELVVGKSYSFDVDTGQLLDTHTRSPESHPREKKIHSSKRKVEEI